MFRRPVTSELLSTGLILLLPLLSLPAHATDGNAMLTGSIVWAADQAPIAGSTLHVGDPKTGEIFSSAPATDDGSFVLNNLPASTYELAVESEGGLYMVETPLNLAPGLSQTLNLAVSRQPDPSFKKTKAKGSFGNSKIWDNPGVTAAVIAGVVVVLGVALGQSDSTSPPAPDTPVSGSLP